MRRRPPALLPLLAASAAAAFAFARLHHALSPFLLAAAFAYVVNPAIARLEALGLRRTHVVVAAYLAAAAASWAAYASIKPVLLEETARLQAHAPAYLAQAQKALARQQARLTARLPIPRHAAERMLEGAAAGVFETLQEAPSHLLAALPWLAHALLVPFIGFFFLMDGPAAVDGLIQACPSRYVEQAIHLLSEIDTALGNYLRGIIIVAAAIGFSSYAGLIALGVDNAFLISILSGVSSLVPYLGAAVGIVVGGGMAFYQFGAFSAFVKVAALFLGIRLADEILLQPVIARHSVHLHPMVFLLAMVLGADLFGFLGLVFAVPAACILKALASVAWSWYASERRLAGLETASGAGVPYT